MSDLLPYVGLVVGPVPGILLAMGLGKFWESKWKGPVTVYLLVIIGVVLWAVNFAP